jgi:hypothetical protein
MMAKAEELSLGCAGCGNYNPGDGYCDFIDGGAYLDKRPWCWSKYWKNADEYIAVTGEEVEMVERGAAL